MVLVHRKYWVVFGERDYQRRTGKWQVLSADTPRQPKAALKSSAERLARREGDLPPDVDRRRPSLFEFSIKPQSEKLHQPASTNTNQHQHTWGMRHTRRSWQDVPKFWVKKNMKRETSIIQPSQVEPVGAKIGTGLEDSSVSKTQGVGIVLQQRHLVEHRSKKKNPIYFN